MNLNVMELPRDSWDVSDTDYYPYYGNNTRFVYNFYLNSGYKGAQFRFSKFFTEQGDTLEVRSTASYPPTEPSTLQATLSGPHKSVYANLIGNDYEGQNQVKFTWNSNTFQGNTIGWHIDQATVLCSIQQAQQNSSAIYANYPVHGLLAKTDDYLYFKAPYDKTKTYFAHLRHLAGVSSTSAYDFDIYIKRGYSNTIIYPSSSNSDFTGSKSTLNSKPLDEMVKIPTTSTNFDTLWVAVRSYNGRGHFQLNVNRVAQEKILETHVGTWPTPATRIAQLKAMARSIYAATEGQVWVKEFKVYENDDDCTGIHCQLYIKTINPDFGGLCNYPWYEDNFIEIESTQSPSSAGKTFNHETGHCWFDYSGQEEYVTDQNSIFHPQTQCGHSAMGGGRANLWGGRSDFCKASDHGKDPYSNSADVGPPGKTGNHLWSYLNNNGIPTPYFIDPNGTNSTPDPYDYYQKNPLNTSDSDTVAQNDDVLFAPFVTITNIAD